MRDLIPRVGSIFAPLAMKIAGGIIVALGIALTIAMMRADSLSGERDEALERVGATQVQLAFEKANRETLEAELAAFVEAGRIRREEAVQSINEARDAGEEMRRAAQEEGRTDWRGVEGL